MAASIQAFVRDEGGATAVEYALLSSLIAIFLVVSLQTLGSAISNEFSEVGNALK